MRMLRLIMLYGATVLGANQAVADGMDRLVIHPAPLPPSVTAFVGFDGAPMDLAMYHGDVVVLNFWATWCGPCRKEMPGLDRLQAEMGDDGLRVVTMAFGRHNPAAMQAFWDKAGIENLPLHRDPETLMAKALGVEGLPHTFVLNADGQVIADLAGDAEWDSPAAKDILRGFLQQDGDR
jgi:thiol-disulfide isomerase/thioredoxin